MILAHVHDPMCSWCWAYRPVLTQLRLKLPAHIRWKNLLGGLAPDSSEPMSPEMQEMVQGHWRKIQRELGIEFNFDFWALCEPRRSTYLSCRAVLAATNQDKEEEMILAIQKAYYLRAMNPSEEDTLVKLAAELEMDSNQFRTDLLSAATERELQNQINTTRTWPISGFPSLVLITDGKLKRVPLDYRSAQVTLSAINALAG